jgi:hypothetical protein
MNLNSNPQLLGERVIEAYRAFSPLQASRTRFHGQVIVVRPEQESLGGEAVNLNILKILGREPESPGAK